jgi:hypothetical protein
MRTMPKGRGRMPMPKWPTASVRLTFLRS